MTYYNFFLWLFQKNRVVIKRNFQSRIAMEFIKITIQVFRMEMLFSIMMTKMVIVTGKYVRETDDPWHQNEQGTKSQEYLL